MPVFSILYQILSNCGRSENIGYIYVTDDVLPNPWDELPPYLAEEAALLVNGSVPLTSEPPISTVTPTTQASLVKTIYDDQDSAFAYSSGWENVSKKQAYNGFFKQTTRKDSFVTFTFTGQSFSILYKSGPTFRKMDVYVDDVLVEAIDEKTDSLSFQQHWDYAGQLAQGNHVLKLVFVTPKKSNNTNGSIDAVIIR